MRKRINLDRLAPSPGLTEIINNGDGSAAEVMKRGFQLKPLPKKYLSKTRTAFARGWIKALLGGSYSQGHNRLCTRSFAGAPAAFCCLGVYSDLRAKAGVGSWDSTSNPDFMLSGKLGYEGSLTELVPTFCEELAMHATYATLLAQINDKGATFEHIAGLLAYWYRLDKATFRRARITAQTFALFALSARTLHYRP